MWCGDGVAQVTLITHDFTNDMTTALYSQMLLTQFVDCPEKLNDHRYMEPGGVVQ